jgi:hypothetical protein
MPICLQCEPRGLELPAIRLDGLPVEARPFRARPSPLRSRVALRRERDGPRLQVLDSKRERDTRNENQRYSNKTTSK